MLRRAALLLIEWLGMRGVDAVTASYSSCIKKHLDHGVAT
jgi:hypothetical protein